MVLRFLSSRTEVLRSLSLDTGRTILIIGAPNDFVEYLNKVLPQGSLSVPTIDDAIGPLNERDFWSVLVWAEDSPGTLEGLQVFKALMRPSSELWVVVNRDERFQRYIRGLTSSFEMSKANRIDLTTKCDLVPLIMRRE